MRVAEAHRIWACRSHAECSARTGSIAERLAWSPVMAALDCSTNLAAVKWLLAAPTPGTDLPEDAMSAELITKPAVEESTSPAPAESLEAVPVPAEIIPLAQVVARIARDSSTEPERYLDEIVVPFGGE